MSSLSQVIVGMSAGRVLVLGDVVADEYVVGRPARISREAPVLILHFTESFVRPGGATNPAYNLVHLGARASLVGVVGDDDMGRRLRAELAAAGVDCRYLFTDTHRPTSTKTRILGKGTQEVQQQIVRIDRVDVSAVDGSLRDAMVDGVCRAMAENDALVISDYENGVISPEVIDACLPAARRQGRTIVVDSHGDLFRFKGITAATPNQPEAAGTLRRPIHSEADLDIAGNELLAGMEAEAILITRGSEGVALYSHDELPWKLPVQAEQRSQVVDPTGAGDTVAAVFTLALLAGASWRQAAYLANVAGGIVVRKVGAATTTQEELSVATSLASEDGWTV